MVKHIAYTQITPLPSNIPRQLALDLLHSHEEFMRLNNLVIDVKSIPAPQNAPADEYFADWLEITERITFLPGVNKKISFKGCFYNQPWGLQNHTIMPSFVEMRNSYRIGGNQPGEPREAREIGVDKPEDGLYLREDIKIDVFVPFAGPFVKKEMQQTSATMIARLKRKAELLDEGRLLALFEDGKLKTTRADTAALFDDRPLSSPGVQRSGTTATSSTGGHMRSPDVNRTPSRYSNPYVPSYQQQSYQGPPPPQSSSTQYTQSEFVSELPATGPQQHGQAFVTELPAEAISKQQPAELA